MVKSLNLIVDNCELTYYLHKDGCDEPIIKDGTLTSYNIDEDQSLKIKVIQILKNNES